MTNEIPITDADLHAYVDGQLSPERVQLVEAWLRDNPGEAKRLEQYQAMSAQLKSAYDPVMDEKIPAQLIKQVSGIKQRDWRVRWAQVAIAASLVIVGGIAGWFTHSWSDKTPNAFMITNLVKPAAFAHSVYATDQIRPVEINAAQQAQLIDWLSQRLRTKIKAPNLTALGYQLVGGRLIPSTNRMAAQFMYQHTSGQRITLYVRRVSSIRIDSNQKQFHNSNDGSLQIVYWRQGELGFALSGMITAEQLKALAASSRQQTSI